MVRLIRYLKNFDIDIKINSMVQALDENQNIEYKECWRDEYLKWICGVPKK
jgi:hypothetical protein